MANPFPQFENCRTARWRSVWLLGLFSAWVAMGHGLAAPALSAQEPVWENEGPLANDTFVDVNPEWEAGLRAGDQLWLRARANEAQGAAAEAMQARAFDAWQSVLARSADLSALEAADSRFAWVRGVDPNGLIPELFPAAAPQWARLYLSPRTAVGYRLQQLGPAAQAAWSKRFDPLAQRALEANPFDLAHLRAVERRFPWTTSAAIAALRRADFWREAGANQSALAGRARAVEHLGLRAQQSPWTEHLRARDWVPVESNAQSKLQTNSPASPAADWRYLRAWRLESRRGRVAPGETLALGRGLRPGMVVRPDGSVIVQTPQALVHIELDEEGLPQPGSKRIEVLSELLAIGRISPITPASTGGWPHLPVLDGERLYLVVDRARPGSTRFEIPVPPRSNHLVALQSRARSDSRVLWQRSSNGWKFGAEPWRSEVNPRGAYEWQPGPVLCDDKLWVLARSLAPVSEDVPNGPVEEFLYLMAFDARSGAWLHQTKIHKASDLAARDESSMARHMATPCAPLALHVQAGQILVQTNQGLCAVIDAATGEPNWMFAYRRRAPRASGWPGSQRPLHFTNRLGLTPGDSDRAYELALKRGQWPLEPLQMQPKGTRQAQVAWDALGWVDYSWRGARGVVGCDPPQGPRQLSFLLGREESFAGFPAVSTGHVWTATTRGLYRLDRTRELYLEQRFILPDQGAGMGGDVTVAGNRVWVLGADTLWLLMSL